MLALRAQVLFVCLTVLLFGIARSYAQSSPAGAGTISGSILDVSGKPIPGAGVSIKNEASGSPRTVVADPEGKFSVSGLPAGTYTLEASAPQFRIEPPNRSETSSERRRERQPLVERRRNRAEHYGRVPIRLNP